MKKLIKKRGNHSSINIGKRIQNIQKSLNNSELLRDFLEFLKKTDIPQKQFLIHFHVESFPG